MQKANAPFRFGCRLIVSCFGALVFLLGLSMNSFGESVLMTAKTETATLGGGCFWCIEAIFQRVNGVEKVESGYSGGASPNPTSEQVSRGNTGHAEVIQLTFDPSKISYAELLEIFFHLHDPTTLNRQGADVGTQYRSVIFYHDAAQKLAAETVLKKITDEKLWSKPIVTELSPFQAFYPAEDYHQNYFNSHQSQPYCSVVIAPKINKLYKEFASKLKKPAESTGS